MAKKATVAHERHRKLKPYSWPDDRPYVPSGFGGIGLPDFDIDLILDRSEYFAAKAEDCPDKSAVLQYVEEARAELAAGRIREAARAAHNVGFFNGRLALSEDAALGKERRETFLELTTESYYNSRLEEYRLEPRLRRMLDDRCDASGGNQGFTDAVRDIWKQLEAERKGFGRDRIERLLRDHAIERKYLRPRPRKKKS